MEAARLSRQPHAGWNGLRCYDAIVLPWAAVIRTRRRAGRSAPSESTAPSRLKSSAGWVAFLVPVLCCLFLVPAATALGANDPSLSGVVPGFCRERLPSSETIRLTEVQLPTEYPARPEDVDSTQNGSVSFHPLQALMPYLVTLDNRALLGTVSAETDGAAIAGLISYLDQNGRIRWQDGIAALVYEFPADGVPAPFLSSMTQSGLAYLASVAYLASGDPYHLKVARAAFKSFLVDYREGGVRVDRGGGAWYEEYASPGATPDELIFVLNGFVYAMQNLAKMSAIGMDATLPELEAAYADGKRALLEGVADYRTTFDWSFYDATGQNRATADYHSYQTLLLRELGCYDGDEQLVALADSLWSDYRRHMPYRLVKNEDGSVTYAHFAGIFPHAYLRDEYATRLVAVDASGTRSGVTVQSIGPYLADDGRPELDTATLPATARQVEVWWHSDGSIPGFPNLYRVDTLATPDERDVASIGRRVACDDDRADLGPLNATNDSLAVSETALGVGSAGAEVCVRLDDGVSPARVALPLSLEQVHVTNRAASVVAGPGSNLATISVGPPGNLTGYKANQATVLLTGLAIDPTTDPDLELPIGYSDLTDLTVDAVAVDGTRIYRYLPPGDRSLSGKPLVITWPSFPGYEAKKIASIVIRASVGQDHVGTIELGEPLLANGTDGLLSARNAASLGGGIYRLSPRGPGIGIGYTLFSRVDRPDAAPLPSPGSSLAEFPDAPANPTPLSPRILLVGLGIIAAMGLVAGRWLLIRRRRRATAAGEPPGP